ncbi:12820_t:CDS:2 [Ambispora gerdemannii]|uniref:12820_t:CDS:1 n=1 Tax=Ambispora gerdemannii TaxID=144530 RepID=A0A9N8Z6P1_9GLOM|nr:12820_t:CDS:2 [Ambispora gerdemannii]
MTTNILNFNESSDSQSLFPTRTTWDVDGDLTETLWWSADNKLNNKGEANLVLFMIPGNPGAIDYYIPFLSTIYEEHEKKIEIVGVSHLGHSHGPHHDSLIKLWSLQDQINHKIKFFDILCEKFAIDEGDKKIYPRFILCGHSMGAYICSQVLKARPDHIEQAYLLFPTLQHIAKTPNGTQMMWMFYDISRNILSMFIHSIRTVLGPNMFKSLIRLITGQSEPHLSTTADRLLHWHVVQNTIYMSDTEMKTIHELDDKFFHEHLNKCILYFGKTDNWAPLEHYHDMIRRFPSGKILLCEVGMEHAFVLKHSEVMGKKVAQWIKDPCTS